MRGTRWLLDALGGEVRIELVHSPSRDSAPRGRSVAELDALLWRGLSARDPAARRVLEQVFDALHGGQATSGHAGWERGPGFESALALALRFAAYSGTLEVEPVVRRRIAPPPMKEKREDIQPVLGPASTRPAPVAKTWIGLVLVDQDGKPVPGRPYRVVHANGTTFNGNLDAGGSVTLTNIDPGTCEVWCPYVAPHPQLVHPVGPNDHASGIAATYGFEDFSVVWSDPANADLKSQRPDPHVLARGDSLTIPEIKETPTASKSTGVRHQFTVPQTTLVARVKMLDRVAKPLAGAQVSADGSQRTADGTGLVEVPIDKTAPSVALQYADAAFTLAVGALNPADDTTEAGYRARLFNLGFLWEPAAEDDADEMTIALEDFQAEYGLTVSGQLDDATKAQLSQVYGS